MALILLWNARSIDSVGFRNKWGTRATLFHCGTQQQSNGGRGHNPSHAHGTNNTLLFATTIIRFNIFWTTQNITEDMHRRAQAEYNEQVLPKVPMGEAPPESALDVPCIRELTNQEEPEDLMYVRLALHNRAYR